MLNVTSSPGSKSVPVSGGQHVVRLADHEPGNRGARCLVGRIRLERIRMVSELETLEDGRVSLPSSSGGRSAPSTFTCGSHHWSSPVALTSNGSDSNDDIRRTAEFPLSLPFSRIRPFHGGRQVSPVTQGRSAINPASDRLDLIVAQGDVVLELLDADRLVQIPRRHLARLGPSFHGRCPRPDFLVGGQRHRRHAVRLMARLALLLKNRRDIFGEGRDARRDPARTPPREPTAGRTRREPQQPPSRQRAFLPAFSCS